MAEMASYRHGVPSWTDVSAPDVEVAGAFYAGLFGWELSPDLGPDAGGYRMFFLRGKTVAGIGPVMDPSAPPAWTTYVTVDDVDGAAALVPGAGGTIAVPPMDLPNDSGRMAFAIDPTGGFVGLFQQGPNHAGSQLANEPGSFVWNELTVRDTETALAFYRAVFGWETEKVEGMDYWVLKVSGRAVGGCMPMGDGWPEGVPTHWMTYFAVDDVDATAARCEELGGAVSVPPQDMPVGRFAVLNDPNGAVFSVGAFTEIDDPNDWPS